jgi:hypothetical protein
VVEEGADGVVEDGALGVDEDGVLVGVPDVEGAPGREGELVFWKKYHSRKPPTPAKRNTTNKTISTRWSDAGAERTVLVEIAEMFFGCVGAVDFG